MHYKDIYKMSQILFRSYSTLRILRHQWCPANMYTVTLISWFRHKMAYMSLQSTHPELDSYLSTAVSFSFIVDALHMRGFRQQPQGPSAVISLCGFSWTLEKTSSLLPRPKHYTQHRAATPYGLLLGCHLKLSRSSVEPPEKTEL